MGFMFAGQKQLQACSPEGRATVPSLRPGWAPSVAERGLGRRSCSLRVVCGDPWCLEPEPVGLTAPVADCPSLLLQGLTWTSRGERKSGACCRTPGSGSTAGG